MPFCIQCGTQNPAEARFCQQCGTKLVSQESAVETTATMASLDRGDTGDRLTPVTDGPEGLKVGTAMLVVQRGPGSGNRYLLRTDLVTSGRHPESEIFLDDVTVSRRHAEFRRAGDTYTVTDVGSLNGTYVNRDRIDTVALRDGDEVQIGKYRLVFFSGHEV